MGLREGQVIAIPVLTRHINTSSGKCVNGESPSTNCVMADALRDRFPGSEYVSVGTENGDLTLADGTHVLFDHQPDMAKSIAIFDNVIDDIRHGGWQEYEEAMRSLRTNIPRVVHATVTYLD